MLADSFNEIFRDIKVPVSDSQFPARVYTLVARERKQVYAKDGDNLKRVCAEEYDDLSKRLDRSQIQESCSVRNVLKTRRLANLLINDKGELNLSSIPKILNHLTTYHYSLGPNRQSDIIRQAHIIKVLHTLSERKELQIALKRIGRPYANKNADQIIRETLQLPENAPINDAAARRAVLAAWMCFLRQNVGSCFATAPAILVHDDNPEQFLKDIEELLGTGRLKRTFGGVEYAVPLSPSWGGGDLKRVFAMQLYGENSYLWQSPGLMAAFEAIGIVNPEDEIKNKTDSVKIALEDATKVWKSSSEVVLTSAEELIRRVLLRRLDITEKDLIDYNNRPRGMIHGNLLMQMPRTSSGGGKGDACATFYTLLSKAENAFKALADNALLKAWEFTLASFAEFKAGFTKWNLYSSLGFQPNQPGGIGQSLQAILQRKLEDSNDKVQQMQNEYETVYSQLKMLEGRYRSVSSEKDAQWMKMEYQSKLNEFHTLEEVRNKHNYKSQRYANLFNTLIQIYDGLFPQYFQEVYDADMQDVSAGPFDDSPAGFRLIYKHGRSNTSQWTPIHTPSEFIDHLANFFIATETEVASNPELKGLEDDISEIVTAIVTQIRNPEFLETAFYRMAEAHKTRPIKNPLEHLDQIEKKPWAYTSGGTMETLVSSYYKREQKPTAINRWVENPTELLVFLLDTIKQVPPKILNESEKKGGLSFLMHSPTHAFILKPNCPPFKEGWENDAFTYTWVRDQWIKPLEDSVDRMRLSEEMQEFLIETLEEKVPLNFRHYFRKVFLPVHGATDTVRFREHIVDRIDHERGLQYQGHPVLSEDEIDRTLYGSLPLFPVEQLVERTRAVFSRIPNTSQEQADILTSIVEQFLEVRNEKRYLTPKQLLDVCKSALLLFTKNTSNSIDYDKIIVEIMRQLRYAQPRPIIFADTNWVKDYFAFLVNPGTGRFDFWRVDALGIAGSPMGEWKQWLNGSQRDKTWGIFTRPHEYSR